MVTDFLFDKAVLFSCPEGIQDAAQHPSLTNNLHVSTATSLHETVPVHHLSTTNIGHESYLLISTPMSSPQAHACETLNTLTHRHTHHTHLSTHTVHTPHKHTHNMNTEREQKHRHNTLPRTQHFRQNQDNMDCRHIDHLAQHKVQAMQLAINMKTHT